MSKEHIPPYRDKGQDAGETGPATRMDRLQAWWDHGELAHPKSFAAACIVGVLLLVTPMAWRGAIVYIFITAVMSGVILVIGGAVGLIVTMDADDKHVFRKTMLISGVAFAVSFPRFQVIDPLADAENAAIEAKTNERLEKECKEYLLKYLPFPKKTPPPQASCPTADGTC